MDERKLGELFRDAVPETPPPAFGVADVVVESGRQTQRKRNALLGGSVLGLAVLTGVAVLSVALWKGTDSEVGTGSAGAPLVASGTGNERAAPNEVPNEDAQSPAGGGGASQEKPSFPPESPKQGGTPTGNAGPPGPGSTPSGCGQADPELAAALAGELRAAANQPWMAATVLCPIGSRAVAFSLADSGKTGLVTFVITPPGTSVDYPVNGSPQGTAVGSGTASGGKRVFVITEPTGASTQAPFSGEVAGVAERLARKF